MRAVKDYKAGHELATKQAPENIIKAFGQLEALKGEAGIRREEDISLFDRYFANTLSNYDNHRKEYKFDIEKIAQASKEELSKIKGQIKDLAEQAEDKDLKEAIESGDIERIKSLKPIGKKSKTLCNKAIGNFKNYEALKEQNLILDAYELIEGIRQAENVEKSLQKEALTELSDSWQGRIDHIQDVLQNIRKELVKKNKPEAQIIAEMIGLLKGLEEAVESEKETGKTGVVTAEVSFDLKEVLKIGRYGSSGQGNCQSSTYAGWYNASLMSFIGDSNELVIILKNAQEEMIGFALWHGGYLNNGEFTYVMDQVYTNDNASVGAQEQASRDLAQKMADVLNIKMSDVTAKDNTESLEIEIPASYVPRYFDAFGGEVSEDKFSKSITAGIISPAKAGAIGRAEEGEAYYGFIVPIPLATMENLYNGAVRRVKGLVKRVGLFGKKDAALERLIGETAGITVSTLEELKGIAKRYSFRRGTLERIKEVHIAVNPEVKTSHIDFVDSETPFISLKTMDDLIHKYLELFLHLNEMQSFDLSPEDYYSQLTQEKSGQIDRLAEKMESNSEDIRFVFLCLGLLLKEGEVTLDRLNERFKEYPSIWGPVYRVKDVVFDAQGKLLSVVKNILAQQRSDVVKVVKRDLENLGIETKFIGSEEARKKGYTAINLKKGKDKGTIVDENIWEWLQVNLADEQGVEIFKGEEPVQQAPKRDEDLQVFIDGNSIVYISPEYAEGLIAYLKDIGSEALEEVRKVSTYAVETVEISAESAAAIGKAEIVKVELITKPKGGEALKVTYKEMGDTKEKKITIEVERAPPELIEKLLPELQNLLQPGISAEAQSLIQNIFNALPANIQNNLFLLNNPPAVIRGIGNSDFIALDARLIYNPIARFHEVIHSAVSAKPELLTEIKGYLEENAPELLGEMLQKNRGDKAFEVHYTIRALERYLFGEADAALERLIGETDGIIDNIAGEIYKIEGLDRASSDYSEKLETIRKRLGVDSTLLSDDLAGWLQVHNGDLINLIKSELTKENINCGVVILGEYFKEYLGEKVNKKALISYITLDILRAIKDSEIEGGEYLKALIDKEKGFSVPMQVLQNTAVFFGLPSEVLAVESFQYKELANLAVVHANGKDEQGESYGHYAGKWEPVIKDGKVLGFWLYETNGQKFFVDLEQFKEKAQDRLDLEEFKGKASVVMIPEEQYKAISELDGIHFIQPNLLPGLGISGQGSPVFTPSPLPTSPPPSRSSLRSSPTRPRLPII